MGFVPDGPAGEETHTPALAGGGPTRHDAEILIFFNKY